MTSYLLKTRNCLEWREAVVTAIAACDHKLFFRLIKSIPCPECHSVETGSIFYKFACDTSNIFTDFGYLRKDIECLLQAYPMLVHESHKKETVAEALRCCDVGVLSTLLSTGAVLPSYAHGMLSEMPYESAQEIMYSAVRFFETRHATCSSKPMTNYRTPL